MHTRQRWLFFCVSIALFVWLLWPLYLWRGNDSALRGLPGYLTPVTNHSPWKDLPQQHPVSSLTPLPTGQPLKLPKVQHDFAPESPEERKARIEKLDMIRSNFDHAWKGYKEHAWLKDELTPLSGGFRDSFGGWAATLVDTLDTLWIMGSKGEFETAVTAVAEIDFSSSNQAELNTFEINIRYLGGFLSAYDLSGSETLLRKAVELGDMLYAAFDTPNRLPVTRWKWNETLQGRPQEAAPSTISAEIGSFSLEFTRLSQITGDSKYYDAVQRITTLFENQQDGSKLPGMWPIIVNAQEARLNDGDNYSFGAMADSLYEYLPKEHMLLDGLRPEYQKMYVKAIETAQKNLFFRPLNPGNRDVLLSGISRVKDARVVLEPQGQHLVCFAGGMVAIAAKLFSRPADLALARKLADGCVWSYESYATGIMPEVFYAVPCAGDCKWSEAAWRDAVVAAAPDRNGTAEDRIREERLAPGFASVRDRRYRLRPEAVESLFVLHRVTGDEALRDMGWRMFQAMEKYARTEIAHAVLDDVTVDKPPQTDQMETFWTAETLKYFFLLFSEPDVISLDRYVFNTEAHPLKRPN